MIRGLLKLLGFKPKQAPEPTAEAAAPPPAYAPPEPLPAAFPKEEPDMGVRFLIERICCLQDDLVLLINAGTHSTEYQARQAELEQCWRDLQLRAKMWRAYTPTQKNGIRESLRKMYAKTV